MGKKILNTEEIDYIKRFIKSKGFNDEGTIIEILDHIACKVEDLLTENPSMQFEEAVRMAHHSFGVKGFATVATDYEHHLKGKYRLIYWNHFKKIFFNPLYFILLIAIGFLTFKIFVWTYLNGIIASLGFNYVELTLMFLMVCFEGYIFEMIRKEKTENLILTTAKSRGILNYTLFIWFVIFPPLSHFSTHYIIFGFIYSLIMMTCIINFFARYKTLKDAKEEYYSMKEGM